MYICPKPKTAIRVMCRLAPKAKAIIGQMQEVKQNNQVVNLTKASLDALFRKLKKRNLFQENIRFHDSRREALTRLAQIYSVMELAKISGHRDVRILLNTYYEPTAKDLAVKMHSKLIARTQLYKRQPENLSGCLLCILALNAALNCEYSG